MVHVNVPSGTVAFLFSDIEGSTRRWELHGDAMRDALRRHDEILRAEIGARGGYVFKTIGDAFCAAFCGAQEALDAAVAAQRRIVREDFRSVNGLHVRMAIHTGATDERDGDYFGPAVNRTARLLSAGHGGQILLSADAALALPARSDGVTLRNLGTLPLRDIREPERIYQAVGLGLPSESKPLRALRTSPNNLPHLRTSFVGRHEDLARVEALVDESPLVTIVGAGGVGKTRLALEVATGRLNDERDGVWFVDLSSLGEAALIAGAILAALGGERSADGDSLGDLIEFLAKRELLVVLDNAEHLISGAATIVAEIIAACPHVTVLATSRSPLDISGERVYRLGSLDDDSAEQLFADRARAANHAFDPADEPELVREICRRLDGVALAIELAAARTRSMSLGTLASHLELRLLAGGRDRRPRQQTMRALIDWSYDLLSQEEQRVLRCCAVFERGFTLPLAQQVCDVKPAAQVFDLVASLVDKSLVVLERHEDEERFRLLAPIREYAWEKLTGKDELTGARRRHAEATASLAQAWYAEWDEGPRRDWIARLDRDLGNLRAALRWSFEESNDTSLGTRLVADSAIVFLRLSLLHEGIEWCRRTLQAPGAADGTEAQLRYGLSMLYANLGAEKECLEQAESAASLYRRAVNRRGLARALSQVASRYAPSARYDLAKPAAQEALQLARASNDTRLIADVLRRCAASFAGDDPAAVRAVFEESVTLFRSLGRDDETARALSWWGLWEQKTGYYESAVAVLEEALLLESGDSVTMFVANDIASSYLAMGDRVRAQGFARRALVLAVAQKHALVAALSVAYLAVVAAERDPNNAARLIGHAQERLGSEKWDLAPPDDATIGRLHALLKREFSEIELALLLKEGAAWDVDQAVSRALSA